MRPQIAEARRVEDHGCAVDQLVAGAQGPPFAGDGIVGAHAKSGQLIVEYDFQPVAFLTRAAGDQPVIDRVAHQPA